MIRLSRTGKSKEPHFRLIISEKTKDPWGKYLEILGYYNPRTNPAVFDVKEERIKYWISKGAQMSDTVHNMLVDKKVLTLSKRKITHTKTKKGTEAAAPAQATAKPAEAKKA